MLVHSRDIEEDANETKIIGIYSTLGRANKTIEKYKSIEGFRDYPDDFYVKKFEVLPDDKKRKIKNNTLYYLRHEYSVDDKYDFVTAIGVYYSYKDAQKERRKLKKKPEYKNYLGGLYPPDGFAIWKYVLDEDYWKDGFVLWDSIDIPWWLKKHNNSIDKRL